MKKFIKEFSADIMNALETVSDEEICKAINILQACYERNGKIYSFGNGGSFAMATHFVSDINKTVFSHHPDHTSKRFQAIRLPSSESELTAWANDVGYDMIFEGPLRNCLQDLDVIVAISSSGNSLNIINAVQFAKCHHVPIIALSGFDGGILSQLADAKIVVHTNKGEYEIVESVHEIIIHLIIKYFRNSFNDFVEHQK